MVGKLETAAATRRRQHQQQLQQQQAQQPGKHHGPGLPEKQHQTRHNATTDAHGGSGSCDQ